MKKSLRILSIIFLTSIFFGVAFAQPVQNKKFEFSTSASLWNVKYSDEETETVLNLPVRIGYFLFKGLEVEPEVFLTIHEDENIGFLLLAHLSYNFRVSEKLFPFILGGGGFGNSEQSFSVVYDYETNIMAFNLGAGIKYLVGDSAAIRFEYRFTKYWGGDNWFDRTDNNLFVGLSIFF